MRDRDKSVVVRWVTVALMIVVLGGWFSLPGESRLPDTFHEVDLAVRGLH